jgi:Holliday junction resolvase RusA-like endonuclease
LTEIRLPFPTSVNAMYAANRGRGRDRRPTPEYEQWRADAAIMLLQQRVRPVLGRCTIWIDLDDRRQGDCDNRAKAVLDLLVKRGVIGGDHKRYVKRVSIGWEQVDGCRVAIEEIV